MLYIVLGNGSENGLWLSEVASGSCSLKWLYELAPSLILRQPPVWLYSPSWLQQRTNFSTSFLIFERNKVWYFIRIISHEISCLICYFVIVKLLKLSFHSYLFHTGGGICMLEMADLSTRGRRDWESYTWRTRESGINRFVYQSRLLSSGPEHIKIY